MHTLQFQPAPACVLETHAIVEVPLSEIRALRDAASPAGAPPLPPRFLRHCDEQTVVGVRAVLEAIAALPEPISSFTGYGVIAAPLQAGRITAAQTLAQVAQAGGVAVSPHVVPQCSLHALASAVSVALGMHGPNLGTSGGPEAVSEGLLTGLSLVSASGCDGLWLVFSEWDEEPVLDASGTALNDPRCRAVALAVRASTAADTAAVTLSLGAVDPVRGGDSSTSCSGSDSDSALAAFGRALGMRAGGAEIGSWAHACPWGVEIRLMAPSSTVPPALRGHHLREAA